MNPADRMARLAVVALALGALACGPQRPLGILPGGPLAGDDRAEVWLFRIESISAVNGEAPR